MAKKNSTKTATKEALQSAEPRLQVFTGWQGINIKDAPMAWSPLETGLRQHQQSDLKPNYLMVQNNLVTDDSGTVQTRPDSMRIGVCPNGGKFTGVVHVHDRWIFCVVRYPAGDQPDPPASLPEFQGNDGPNHITDNFVDSGSHIDDVISGGISAFVERIVYAQLPAWGSNNAITSWKHIVLCDSELGYDPPNYEITEIGIYENRFIALTRHEEDSAGEQSENKSMAEMFTGDYTENWQTSVSYEQGVRRIEKGFTIKGTVPSGSMPKAANVISSPVWIPEPVTAPGITGRGVNVTSQSTADSVERVEVQYIYCNKFGITMASAPTTVWTDVAAVAYHAKAFIEINGTLPTTGTTWEDSEGNPHNWTTQQINSITGVDTYLSTNNETNKAFAGHVEITGSSKAGKRWKVNYLGSIDSIDDWDLRDHDLPDENSTKGVFASYFAIHDSRLYFWGNPDKPYRLYIGGAPGAELSIARGYGGAWVDIEPGSGLQVKGTAKWKTSSGANIITIMCGNPNTGMVKRFNLVETNLVLTNEVSSKGYMYEEVSNVVGCNSRWGYGVYDDGLYSVSRYGLKITTMAMEYNNQMKSQNVSDVIQPVFTDRLGSRLKDCRMVCIDSVIYLALKDPNSNKLDQVILVYDIEKKAWYTFTHDETITDDDPVMNSRNIPQQVATDTDRIVHLFSLDSDEKPEGLGVITDGYVWLYPTAGHDQDRVVPAFHVLLETGEITTRMPVQGFHYLHQLELRFDYFMGSATVIVEGEDYYGRAFKIEKTLDKAGRSGVINAENYRGFREYTEHIMVGKLVQSYRIRIKGKARFRLVSIIAKVYMQSNRIATMYGWDDHDSYADRHGKRTDDHHYVESYNNLIRGYDDLIDAIVT